MASEAMRAALRNARRTLVKGALIGALLGLPLLLPASMFMRATLDYYPAGATLPSGVVRAEDVIRQQRRMSWPMRLEWHAVVFEIAATPVRDRIGQERRIIRCEGGGAWYYEPDANAKIIPLDVWVGEPCHLRPGTTYVARAEWTKRLLLWTWVVVAETEPFTVPVEL